MKSINYGKVASELGVDLSALSGAIGESPYDLAGDEELGDEELGDEELGDEELGDEELSGPNDELGAMNPRLARMRRIAKARRRFARPRRRITQSQIASTIRHSLVPLGATSVGAGATVTLEIKPQCRFKATQLVIQEATAGDFNVTQIMVGRNPQFVVAGVVPAAVFAPNATALPLEFDVCDTSESIFISVVNTTAGALTVDGCLYGFWSPKR